MNAEFVPAERQVRIEMTETKARKVISQLSYLLGRSANAGCTEVVELSTILMGLL